MELMGAVRLLSPDNLLAHKLSRAPSPRREATVSLERCVAVVVIL